MTSTQRVQCALDFRKPDYIPLFDQYWGGFVAAWRACHQLPPRSDIPLDDIVYDDEDIYSYFRVDMYKAIPDEDPWPHAKQKLGVRGEYIIERDGWGRTVSRKATSPYGMPLELPLVHKSQLDTLGFEPAGMDDRYDRMLKRIAQIQGSQRSPYIFIKIGGPYLRSSFLRGEYQWFVWFGVGVGCRLLWGLV